MAFLGFNPELPSRPFRAASPSDLPAFLSRIAQLDREFVIYDDGWRGWTYSYSEIEQMAKALAARFVSNGIGKGDAVLIWSESRPGWIAALWACLIEGVVLVPVEQQSSPSLLHRIEQQVEPLVILLGDLVPRFQEPYRLPVWSLRDIEADLNRPALDPVPLSVDDVAEIVFTSGTTGEPKGVVMTHRNLAASLRPIEDQLAPYRRYLQFLAPLRVLNLLPLSHLFGQTIALFLVPLIPASVVFLSSTSPEEIARQIRTRRMCALVSVPKVLEVMRDFVLHRFPETKDAKKAVGSLLVRLWRHRAVHRLFGWRFCCFVVGGAPLSPELEQFWSNLGFVVAQGYGLTETAPIVSFNHPFHVQKGTAGKPIAGIEIKVADDGEVLVRGDNVTPGYFHRATETAAVFQDGWFHTGDIGELGPQGDLVIRGRKKDLIVTPEGLKVFPEDVEGILDCIDGVRESAVIDKDGVHAVLVLEPGFQGEEILRQANRQLEPHQRIRSFTPWGQAELPRTTTTQKLRRAAIAEALRTGKRESGKHTLTIADLVQKYAPGRIITSDTTLEELGLSSLDRVELLMDLEEKLDTSVDESMFSSASTVADLTSPPAAAKPTPQPTYNRLWIAKLIRRLLLPTIVLPLTKSFAHFRT
jgi:long-chain acyl-CoA synthetase